MQIQDLLHKSNFNNQIPTSKGGTQMQISLKKIAFIMVALTLALFTFMVPVQKIKAEETNNVSGKDDIKLEAEKGTLNGLNKESDKTASGKAYVDGFDGPNDSLKVTANIKTSGTYTIIIAYKTIGGSKVNPVYVNNTKIPDFSFADTADFKEVIVGNYDLGAGKNTFEIGMSWGWIAVDYIRFVGGDGKQVSKVDLSLDATQSAAYDIPVTLKALADNAAQYKFMVHKVGEDWKDISSYTESNSCIWVPGQPGDYEIKVYARGNQTKGDKQAEATVTYKALESYVNKPLVSQMFGDNMVLQRNEVNTIYGWDKPGTSITVKLAMKVTSQTYTGVTDDKGEWSIDIGTHRAGGTYSITVKGSSNTVKLKNIVFGDVYLCSGQSNMAFTLDSAENGAKEIENSNYSKIRFIKIPEATSAVPVKTMNSTAVWQECSMSNSQQLSAVAYFYARKLNKDLKVPIGIVFSAVGGTKAESWTSYDSLKNLPDYSEKATKITTGEDSIQLASSPIALYNGMIAPVAPFKLKGVLWYQGESNWGEKAYNVLLPTLIADWRKHFNDSDLPFIIIQITAYGQTQTDKSPVQSFPGLPEVREAQLRTMLNDKNVGLVTICDLGNPGNIHPTNKQDVGARAAICAEGKIYGKDIVYSGPIYDSMAIDGSKITISFTSTGSGLIVGSKNGLDPVKEVTNGKLTGFAIAGADGVFYSADAVISGDKVIVSSSKVANPVTVRYGWYDSPVINLYNKEGLIASPFRTDVN